MARGIHLVGSIRFDDAETVFRELAARLGPRASRWPDGETGERHYWIVWQRKVFEASPDFDATDRRARPEAPVTLFALREGAVADGVVLGPLGYAAAALDSYETFARLRAEGVVPEGVRFMVALPTPTAVVTAFVIPEHLAEVEAAYQRALTRELAAILDAVPARELAIQWDVMHETVAEAGGPFVLAYDDGLAGTVTRLARLSAGVPEAAELGFHLCYGDAGHQHVIEPEDLSVCVRMANAIVRSLGRRVDWIHVPVPRDRDDDACFAPLDALALPPETTLALGLVHHTDGAEGTRRRMAAASRRRGDFAIGTECGFGRRDPATMRALLDLHAEMADVRAFGSRPARGGGGAAGRGGPRGDATGRLR